MLGAPLVQFLSIGLALYLGVAFLARAPDAATGRRDAATEARDGEIVVGREALLAFVQRRTQEPDPTITAAAFDALDAAGRQLWIDRFVREEALVREARALGLDRDDELIRRRLVQQMEFLTLGTGDASRAVGDDALAAYYSAHVEDHRIPASVTFAHVFVRDSRARAEALLTELIEKGAGFEDSLASGDRFLYNRHYVDRTLDEVRSHFGSAMAEALAGLEPDPKTWRGPIASDHGWHLVLLTDLEASRLPSLEEIAEDLRRDLERERSERALEDGIRAIVARYRIELEPGLEPGLEARGSTSR